MNNIIQGCFLGQAFLAVFWLGMIAADIDTIANKQTVCEINWPTMPLESTK